MSTKSFQLTDATMYDEVLNTTSMLQIKGGTDDKRASRPTKGFSKVKATEKKIKNY